jgi:polyhydroxyalkanoate synthesis regulator phasin
MVAAGELDVREVRRMSTDNTGLTTFNQMVDAWVKAASDAERRWNEYFNRQMATDEFTQMMTRTMEAYATIQANFARGMEQYLRSLSIPTQSDLAALAERLTVLERRLDALAGAGDDSPAPAKPAGRKRTGRARSAS